MNQSTAEFQNDCVRPRTDKTAMHSHSEAKNAQKNHTHTIDMEEGINQDEKDDGGFSSYLTAFSQETSLAGFKYIGAKGSFLRRQVQTLFVRLPFLQLRIIFCPMFPNQRNTYCISSAGKYILSASYKRT